MKGHSIASRVAQALFGTKQRTLATALAGILVAGVVLVGLGYWYVVTGGMTARRNPTATEMYVARSLVNLGIPAEARRRTNPLSSNASGADIDAGRDLYQEKCQTCHAYDGSGRTAAGRGLYPPAADLRSPEVAKQSDGAIFYLVQNGIRNTGMPAWQLPDRQIWQIILFLRNLPHVSATGAAAANHVNTAVSARYVGSAACRTCHESIYDRWKKTRMANVVRDPRAHPDAIIPDLSKRDPLVTFTADEIAFVYGSRWKQRYFKKVGDDYYPLPAQWDVTHAKWRPYFVKDDWWVKHYPPENSRRPTSTTCDGCHSVNYNTTDHTVTEWNVGCERCHGPGGDHVSHPRNDNIVNPSRLDYVQSNDTCIQCHSQGRPPANPIAGKYYDWPVGFQMGLKLNDFWKLEEHRLGETTFTHFADGTAHKNRMQGNDFVTSLMYTHGVNCSTCHDAHGSDNEAMLRKPASTLCLDCHGPRSPNGPRAATIEQHTHHKAGSPGAECIACHMPEIAQTLGDVNVRSHTFHFVTPAHTDALKIPNACNVCHTDKSSAWATAALNGWTERSPWRTGG